MFLFPWPSAGRGGADFFTGGADGLTGRGGRPLRLPPAHASAGSVLPEPGPSLTGEKMPSVDSRTSLTRLPLAQMLVKDRLNYNNT